MPSLAAFKTSQQALFSNERPSTDQTEGGVGDWGEVIDEAIIDLSSKLSFTFEGNVNYQQSVRHPLSTLPMVIGRVILEGAGRGTQHEITTKSTRFL